MATQKKSTNGARKVSATSKTKSAAKKPAAKKAPAKPHRAAKPKEASPRLDDNQRSLLAGIIILFLTAVLTLSLLSPNQGQFTVWLSGVAGLVVGVGRYAIPLLSGAIGGYLVLRGMEQEPPVPTVRLAGLAVLAVVFLALASLVAYQRDARYADYYAVAAAGAGGGYAGSIIATALIRLLGGLGTIITLVVVGAAGAVLFSGVSRAQVSGWFAREPRPSTGATPATGNRQPPADAKVPGARGQVPGAERSAPAPNPYPLTPNREQPPLPLGPTVALKTAGEGKREKGKKSANDVPPPIFLGADAAPALGDALAETSLWTLPRVADVLESGTDVDVNSASIRERVEIIEHTLDSFGAPATVVEINQGPTITQFGVEPNYLVMRGGKRTKVKVGKIASLADDLALALAARSIRIQAPVPGKGYVGIEVPNSAKALVSLRDVMESDEYARMKSPLRIGLGQNVAGQPIVADLAAMPHLLIAGTTGSGKSVCVNGLIACLLLQNTPDDLRLVMVDPKRVELTGYNGVPHLAAPVVVDMDRVIGTLQWALREMDNRYKLFSGIGARNIVEYNKKVRREPTTDGVPGSRGQVPGEERSAPAPGSGRPTAYKLPYIVIVIDELADLMMLAPEDTERSITRLAQMARATGIHMVIATQRPSVDVVTGLIKANFPARIAFAVASSTDSRVILDTTGAERLLGQGDMLFQSPDAAAPVRLQGCFVSDGELQKLISYWQTARRTQFIAAPAGKVPGARGQVTGTRGHGLGSREDRSSLEPGTSNLEPDAYPPVPPPISHLNAPEPMGGPPPPQRRAPRIPTAPAGTTTDGQPPTAARGDSRRPTTDDRPQVPGVERSSPGPSANFEPYVPPGAPHTQPPLWETLQAIDGDDGSGDNGEADDLLPEAIALVRSLNKASTSLLQRRFRIGYTRAARLMDALEEAGIIGPPTGTSKAREVYGSARTADEGDSDAAAEEGDGAGEDTEGA